MTRIAILTPAPGYYEDWGTPAGHYRGLLGDKLEFRAWSDPGDLSGFALILPLLAWGYQRAPADWYAALDGWAGLPFANGVETLRWNTEKGYLSDLEAAGVAVVPTRVTDALSDGDLAAARAGWGETGALVVKPAISGGADGTYRLAAGEAVPADVAGLRMLIQPLMPAIASEGEFSLFLFDGAFSHAILKRPAQGDFRVQEQFGGTEIAVDAPAAALALARAAIEAAPQRPLYARVDMVRDASGDFRLMELELIEPSLFLQFASDGGAMFADAVKRAAV